MVQPAKLLPRVYTSVLRDHFERTRQMAFVAGPRQVGKTTVCRSLDPDARYVNWDDQDDRKSILRGPKVVAQMLELERLGRDKPLIVFDEIHKYARWKSFLKGFYDGFGDRTRVVVTGSSRLDVYRRGGDSLMGRYFLYRMHPLSVGELLRQDTPDAQPIAPAKLAQARFDQLYSRGGFPEPFLHDARFALRWRGLRRVQLVREDVRDLTRIQELHALEVLVELLGDRSGSSLSFSELAGTLNVTVETTQRWVETLVSLHHGFLVRPWFKNVTKSLRKAPKWYVTDWASVEDPGQRAETFVAVHLLKAVQLWEDLGHGTFELRYLRDKQQREVDFVIVRDGKPWFLVEVKLADTSLSKSLAYYQEQVGAKHAFQAVVELPYVAANPFERKDPCVVPAATLLSQLP
jgi:hypothetical protein